MTKEEFKAFVHKAIDQHTDWTVNMSDTVKVIVEQWQNDNNAAFIRGQNSVYESGDVNWS